MTPFARLLLAASLPLALAACSEETAQAPTPPPTAQAPTPPPAEEQPAREPQPNRTDEAMDDLRQGAESIARGARTLFEEGREAAGRAIEDSGPAIERARELAREFGIAAGEVAERMSARLNEAVDELNRRIQEADEPSTPATGDAAARLGDPDGLRADTLAAARAARADVGPAYVGAWAGSADNCARIDREPVEMFAVITPSTIRRAESVCNFSEALLSEGRVSLDASCIAEGEVEDRTIILEMPSDDVLEIGSAEAAGRATLVRCHLGG